ncbi:MAG: hypothetical protein ACQEXV_19540 [Bacillota bacterium]
MFFTTCLIERDINVFVYVVPPVHASSVVERFWSAALQMRDEQGYMFPKGRNYNLDMIGLNNRWICLSQYIDLPLSSGHIIVGHKINGLVSYLPVVLSANNRGKITSDQGTGFAEAVLQAALDRSNINIR